VRFTPLTPSVSNDKFTSSTAQDVRIAGAARVKRVDAPHVIARLHAALDDRMIVDSDVIRRAGRAWSDYCH